MNASAPLEYLRPKDVAERSRISVTQVYRAIYSGELPAIRFKEKTWLILPSDAANWIQSNSSPNTPVDAAKAEVA